jgi:hypothetical protein
MIEPADEYLEKAQDAEARANATADAQLKARWLGIAFGYRELSRYRNSLRARGLPPVGIVEQDEASPASRLPS